jgi:hypothetical protein
MKCGFCKWCGLNRPICESHAIPNSVFRLAKREAKSSQLTLVANSAKFNGKNDQGSGAWPLLCHDCELFFKKRFDDFGLSVLHRVKGIEKHDDFILITSLDSKRFSLFVLSVFWRASLSEHGFYSQIRVEEKMMALIKRLGWAKATRRAFLQHWDQ